MLRDQNQPQVNMMIVVLASQNSLDARLLLELAPKELDLFMHESLKTYAHENIHMALIRYQ